MTSNSQEELITKESGMQVYVKRQGTKENAVFLHSSGAPVIIALDAMEATIARYREALQFLKIFHMVGDEGTEERVSAIAYLTPGDDDEEVELGVSGPNGAWRAIHRMKLAEAYDSPVNDLRRRILATP